MFQKAGAEAILACQARISKNSHQGWERAGKAGFFFFYGFVHLLATTYSPAWGVGWIFFFFLMRLLLGVFGKRSVDSKF